MKNIATGGHSDLKRVNPAATSAPQPRLPPCVPNCVNVNGWSNMQPPISSICRRP